MPQTDPRHDQSVGRILAKRLATLGDAPLIVADGGILTYGEVDRASNRLANGIEALGIVKHRMPDVKIYLYGSPPRERGGV